MADETTELPEGTEVELAVTRIVDPFAHMSPEERSELEQELEDGRRDFDKGDHEDARQFIARLSTKP